MDYTQQGPKDDYKSICQHFIEQVKETIARMEESPNSDPVKVLRWGFDMLKMNIRIAHQRAKRVEDKLLREKTIPYAEKKSLTS